jgi:hypothetical protein
MIPGRLAWSIALVDCAGRLSLVDCRWSIVAGRLSLVDCRWSIVAGRLSLVDRRWSIAPPMALVDCAADGAGRLSLNAGERKSRSAAVAGSVCALFPCGYIGS